MDASGKEASKVVRRRLLRRLRSRDVIVQRRPSARATRFVLLDADGEWDLVVDQEFDPIGANELAIGEQQLDRGRAEQAQIALHQFDALAAVAVALAIDHRPQQRHAEAPRHDGQHENVDVLAADLPVGAVERQVFGPRQVQHPYHDLCDNRLIQPDRFEKSLQAPVVRPVLRRSREMARNMAQIDRTALDQPHNERPAFQPRIAKREMLGSR